MPYQISDHDKINEYLRVIEERILAPIENTEVQYYCTATMLILFAAIDGLGKLLHPKNKAGSNERIRKFLDYMGGDYQTHKKKLINLRNSLVHNAINVESFFSHAEISSDFHLKEVKEVGKEVGIDDFICVNTRIMYRDFIESFKRFRVDIQNNPAILKRAADRLEWREVKPLEDLNIPVPSPPPPVQFIRAK